MVLDRFLNKMKVGDTHSNEYAKASVTTQTFNQRVITGKRRKSVGSYRQSKLGQSYIDPEMRRTSYRKPVVESNESGFSVPNRSGSDSLGLSIPPRSVFAEPQVRKYNPYS